MCVLCVVLQPFPKLPVPSWSLGQPVALDEFKKVTDSYFAALEPTRKLKVPQLPAQVGGDTQGAAAAHVPLSPHTPHSPCHPTAPEECKVDTSHALISGTATHGTTPTSWLSAARTCHATVCQACH